MDEPDMDRGERERPLPCRPRRLFMCSTLANYPAALKSGGGVLVPN